MFEFTEEQIDEIVCNFTIERGVPVTQDLLDELVPYLTEKINLKMIEADRMH